ncbi:hypothetical protein Pogu_2031 [Pyrobaculum oguniense TE7]|uniref:Uncharacterized protein n=1 Tax=Pyrobaculum oguniense (strain DSM 13380 / JCM 10595 / TE7) TaxID=698757 RepID=H6QB61_PYROT|nr:hypothetical protein Pogu_2031 [Pyrobaculum oguniense TE7]
MIHLPQVLGYETFGHLPKYNSVDGNTRLSGMPTDEIPLDMPYDQSGIRDIPFIVTIKHKRSPRPHDAMFNITHMLFTTTEEADIKDCFL